MMITDLVEMLKIAHGYRPTKCSIFISLPFSRSLTMFVTLLDVIVLS
jgi:hypothetical protein